MNKKIVKQIVVIFITAIFFLILYTQISLSEIISLIYALDPMIIGLSFALYAFGYVLRAVRFFQLLNGRIPLRDLMAITSIHTLMINLIPAKIGELSYVYLLKRYHCCSTGDGLVTLIIARISDMIGIIFLFFLSFFIVMHRFEVNSKIILITLIAFSLFLALVIIGIVYISKIIAMIDRLNLNSAGFRMRLLTKTREKLSELEKAIIIIKKNRISFFIKIQILSLLIWVEMYIYIYYLMIGFGQTYDFVTTLFASSFVIFSTMLPIQGFGGFGTQEGGWVLGFITVGMSKELALSTGFSFHLITLAYSIILGLIGSIYLKTRTS